MRNKYIRTEDKIYEVKSYYMMPLDYPQYSVKGSDKVFYEANVKGADTIEELCDEFIGIMGERHIHSQSKDLWVLKDCDMVYGAVWTNNGLKYVAKLNQYGKLELL